MCAQGCWHSPGVSAKARRRTQLCTCERMLTHTHCSEHTCERMLVHTSVSTHVSMCSHTHTSVNTHVSTCSHTHTYWCTYKHTCLCFLKAVDMLSFNHFVFSKSCYVSQSGLNSLWSPGCPSTQHPPACSPKDWDTRSVPSQLPNTFPKHKKRKVVSLCSTFSLG